MAASMPWYTAVASIARLTYFRAGRPKLTFDNPPPMWTSGQAARMAAMASQTCLADSASAENSYDALKKYARDLTEVAREGKIDPVIGRDEEIRRAIQVLSRRTKNNPVLIGEPGVGKTAIAEGLAIRGVWESPQPDTGPRLDELKPGSEEHRQRFLPFGLAVVAEREKASVYEAAGDDV